MNIYDSANQLARELKGSSEYQKFLEAKKLLETDGDAKKMVQDFLMKQLQVEYATMTGQAEDVEQKEQFQKMYEVILVNEKARTFLEAHMRFQRIIGDIYKIIGEAVSEGMDFLDKK